MVDSFYHSYIAFYREAEIIEIKLKIYMGIITSYFNKNHIRQVNITIFSEQTFCTLM